MQNQPIKTREKGQMFVKRGQTVMSGCSTKKGDRSLWHPVTFMLVRVLSAKLFYEADSNTVLLRSLERIDGVTEIFSDDPVLIDTCSNDGSSNDLRSLL